MPKIRGIKPEFWTDEDVVELSMPARLLFIGLWNLACDNGHVPDKPKQIKMRILPADDVDAHALLTELEVNGRIDRVAGTITIHNFSKHQRPHRRWWSTCDLPLCEVPEGAPEQGYNRGSDLSHTPSQPVVNRGTTVGNGRSTADVDGEVDVDSEGDGERRGDRSPKRASQRPASFRPSEKHLALAAELGVDLQTEWLQFCDHHTAKGSTFKDWSAALNTWIRKAAKFKGNVRPLRSEPDEQGRILLPPLPGNEWSGR